MTTVRDKDLFTQPNSSCFGDCPICCLPLPIEPSKLNMTPCCSKIICLGCGYANVKREIEARLEHKCLFCREPVPKSVKEAARNGMKRAKKNDPAALSQLGKLRQAKGDHATAFIYFTKAAKFGDALAHANLADMYSRQGVEKDVKKHIYHLEEAAIGGHPEARHRLGCEESLNGNFERAKKHFIIAANLGYCDSLKTIKGLYELGCASKEEYADALHACQAAVDATKSPERELGAVAMKNGRFKLT